MLYCLATVVAQLLVFWVVVGARKSVYYQKVLLNNECMYLDHFLVQS